MAPASILAQPLVQFFWQPIRYSAGVRVFSAEPLQTTEIRFSTSGSSSSIVHRSPAVTALATVRSGTSLRMAPRVHPSSSAARMMTG